MTWQTVFRAWRAAEDDAARLRSEVIVTARATVTPEWLALRERCNHRYAQRARFWGWLVKRSAPR